MSSHDDHDLPPAPPPPSPALLQAMAQVTPVRTRRPLRSFALVAAVCAAWGGLWLTLFPRRPDLPWLPQLGFALVALVWVGGFVAPLAAALVPRRGSVLPDGARTLRLALAAAAALVLVGFVTPDAPGHSLFFAGVRAQAAGVARCMTFALVVSIVPIVVGLVALRRMLLVGSARITAAVGAAGGALGGFVLLLLCPVGGALHAAVGHGGGVVAAALAGAAVGALVDRRRA